MRRLAVVALLALAFPAAASAHATLEHATPGFQQRVETSPRAVVLGFDQRVTVLPGTIRVVDARGRLVSAPAHPEFSGRHVVAPLHRLARGPYTVRWHVLAGDGHVVSGVYTFGFGVAAPPPTEAYGASGPTRSEHVVRWLYFLALALVTGGLGCRLLVVRGVLPPRAEKRFFLLTGFGALAAIDIGIIGFILRAEDALQLPFARLLYGDLTPIANGTRVGTAFVVMTLGFAFLAALLFLAWLTDRTALLWGAFALALLLTSGLSLSGHSAADAGSSWKSELADWVHLSAASIWIGGLVQLAVVVLPLAPELRRASFLRFSSLATVLVALVLAAGTYLSILRLPHVHDLWTTRYGHVLLVKLGLVALALAWGAFHRLVAVPRVAAGGEGSLASLPRSVLGESIAGMAVLLAAAVLVDSKPPPRGVPAQTVARKASTLATKTFVSGRTPRLRTAAGP